MKAAIVTGASRGIGRGIARVLGREGFAVGAVARSRDLLDEAVREIREAGGTAAAAPCDLRDPAATEEAVRGLAEELGGADALVNNAGVVTRKSALEISLDEWREMIDTNVHGVFHATRAVLPLLRDRGAGDIINISSISGRLPLPGGSGYAASKWAVTGFSESLFQEVRDLGIRVTTVFPGSVDSASHRHGESVDASWKVPPEQVGEACVAILRAAPGTCVSRLEIRPLSRPPR